MIYKDHKYFLEIKEINAALNIDVIEMFGSEQEADVLIRDVTSSIYAYLKAHFILSFKNIEYLIFHDDDIKETFKEILISQARYAVRSDGDMIGDIHLVNRRLGSVIDVESRSKITLSDTVYKLIHGTFYQRYNFKVTNDIYRVGY